MHDEVITLFDDCIADMMLLRAELAASRRVEPGERHTTVLAAIAAAERFALQADQTLAPVRGSTVTFAPATTLRVPTPAVTLPVAAPSQD
ncbi:MAG TPA: hypothetical protein VN408_39835 [Actinoplanes sp.]|nr:hypothetical protein [Actinoplanes sp.]